MIKNYQKIIRSSICIFIMIFLLIFIFKYSKQNKIKAVENKKIQNLMTSQELREKLNKQNHKIYTNEEDSEIIYHCHKIKYKIKPTKEEESSSYYVQFLYDKQLLNDKWYLQGKENEKYSIGKTFYHYTNNHSDYKIEFKGRWFLK